MSESRVAIAMVTHNDAADLAGCFSAIAAIAIRHPRPLDLVVVDCASADDSVATARRLASKLPPTLKVTLLPLSENLGFAGGMNAALAATEAPFVLTLNADARPSPDFVERLLERMETPSHLRIGAVAGRLVRPDGDNGSRLLDACGMRLAATWRHFDRGSGELDRGQYSQAERVFGATGAASLFRRAALDDVRFSNGEIFDPLFHSFREDAELCFRLRERGWEVVYEPRAVAEHRRFNLPERRSAMPPAVNFHSLKNRYLLRAYHQTPRNFWRTAIPTLSRDVLALGYTLLRERSSLGAYAWLWRNRRKILARRSEIQGRRTSPAAALDRWFFRAGEPL